MLKEILNKIRSLLVYKLLISVIISGILTNFFIIKLDGYLDVIVNQKERIFECNLVNLYLYLYLLYYKKFSFIIVIGVYLSVIYFVYVLLEVLEVVYSWLWETSYIKWNKVKKKYKKIDTKKLSLLWAIIIFILGILFNFKK